MGKHVEIELAILNTMDHLNLKVSEDLVSSQNLSKYFVFYELFVKSCPHATHSCLHYWCGVGIWFNTKPLLGINLGIQVYAQWW